MNLLSMLLPILFVGLFSPVAEDGDVTLDSVPPVVVKTIPEAGAKDIDPKIT